jgi:hypothetical protein
MRHLCRSLRKLPHKSASTIIQLGLGSRGFACLRRLFFFGRVEVEDFAALSGSRINGAHVLAALHLPDRRDDSIFLDGLIRDLVFGRGRVGLRWGGFVFRHATLTGSSLTARICLRYGRFWHSGKADVQRVEPAAAATGSQIHP